MNLKRMSREEMVNLLRQAGSKQADTELVEDWIRDGLPTNQDGTVDFLELMRFLASWNPEE